MVGAGGRGEKLSSTLQRIDYGDASSTQDMVAEGRTGDLVSRFVSYDDTEEHFSNMTSNTKLTFQIMIKSNNNNGYK